jgi:hypothetical protein
MAMGMATMQLLVQAILSYTSLRIALALLVATAVHKLWAYAYGVKLKSTVASPPLFDPSKAQRRAYDDELLHDRKLRPLYRQLTQSLSWVKDYRKSRKRSYDGDGESRHHVSWLARTHMHVMCGRVAQHL